jgi:hypothetical protein
MKEAVSSSEACLPAIDAASLTRNLLPKSKFILRDSLFQACRHHRMPALRQSVVGGPPTVDSIQQRILAVLTSKTINIIGGYNIRLGLPSQAGMWELLLRGCTTSNAP